MPQAPPPPNETKRLAALHAYGVLDTPQESDFDELVELASRICEAPIALVSLVDAHRQWFKAKVGLGASETPREYAFCAHAILENVPFVVPDSHTDERFADNPLVTSDPRVRFYAGIPLKVAGGFNLGTLCVIDHVPRELRPEQLRDLQILARQVVTQLELRRTIARLQGMLDEADEQAAAVVRAQSEIDLIAYAVSHDLKAPMRAMANLAEWADDELAAGHVTEARNHVDLIRRRGMRMSMLLDALFTYTRIGRTKPAYAPVNVGRLVAEIVAVHKESGMQFEVPEDLPIISGDAADLSRVFTALIENAVTHRLQPGGIVRISAAPAAQPGYVTFSVADDGSGIDPRFHTKIFELFYTLAARDEKEMAGVGLAIVKKTVSLYGGSVSLDSEPERGSTFRFTWPLASRGGA